MSELIQLVGADKAIELFRSLPEKTRKAASNAINDTLKDVQTKTGTEWLPHAFTLRGKGKQWWEQGQKFGFNIRPYSNAESLTGTMGSQADWLKLQEQGGTKSVAGHNLAIPATGYKPTDAIMARAIKPRTILDRKSSGAFKATMPNGFEGIFKRVGKDRFPLKLLFSLEPTSSVKKRLDFEANARKLADDIYVGKFAIQFTKMMGL